MTFNISNLLESLGWAILHSLWQGVLGLILVLIIRSVLKGKSPAVRYWAQTAVLAGCFLAFLATLAGYIGLNATPQILGESAGGLKLLQITDLGALPTGDINTAASALPQLINDFAPVIALIWCLGFCIMAMRYTGSYILTQKLRTEGISIPDALWTRRFADLTARAGLPDSVKLLISDRISGPLTLGFFKPIVLVPAGFLASLPSDQIEAILLHEIAHIRRCDYAINLIQTAIKTVFFYHPAVHFISHCIDLDREQACDDLAVAQGHDPKALAKGLAALRLASAPRFALSALGRGRDTPLLARLKRLSGYSSKTGGGEPVIVSTLAAVLIATLYVGASVKADAHPQHSEDRITLHAKAAEHNYTFETIQFQGRKIVVKITQDGRRWVHVDSAWTDIDANPSILAQVPVMPQPPAPPKYENLELAGAYDINRYVKDADKTAGKFDQFQIDLQYFEKSLELYAENTVADQEAMERAQDIAERYQERAADQFHRRAEQISDHLERQDEALMRSAEAEERRREAQIRREEALMQRHESKERIHEARQRAEEALHEAHRAKDEQSRTRHTDFKKALTNLLLRDGIISSKSDPISVTYGPDSKIINGVNVSELPGKDYCALWEKYGILKSDQSSIKITPETYQIIETDGKSRHSTRVTYGKWDSKDEASLEGIKANAKANAKVGAQSAAISHSISRHTNHAVNAASSVTFIMPVSTDEIGMRNGNSVKGVFKSHNGIDMLAPMGQPIYASADGTVISAKASGDWGYRVVIRHKDNYKTYYGHMADMKVTSGNTVKAGQVIGIVGKTGGANSSHLHFEIRQNGQVLDPEPFIFSESQY